MSRPSSLPFGAYSPITVKGMPAIRTVAPNGSWFPKSASIVLGPSTTTLALRSTSCGVK